MSTPVRFEEKPFFFAESKGAVAVIFALAVIPIVLAAGSANGNCSNATGATYNWEDGGDANFQDFVYNMKCTTGVAADSLVRLVK
jgi:hypothetical protein